MSKAVISNRIYLEGTPELIASIKEKLTYSVPTFGDNPPLIIRNFSMFRNNIITFPVGRVDLIPTGYTIVDKRVQPKVELPDFGGTLRESQADIVEDFSDNCLVNAKVGFGKTFTGLGMAHKMGVKTLIVVHTLALMQQWSEEVEALFGFKPDTIGGGKAKWDTPIVIGNVASLYNRATELAKVFGMIIVDEVHHAPSRTFAAVVDKSHARYKVGLSGTLVRKDGKHVVIVDYFGTKVYIPPKENTMDPEIHVYDTGVTFPYGGAWANRVSELNRIPDYKKWVCWAVDHYADLGHKVLVVADRVEFLKEVAEGTGSALITGETTDRDGQFALLDNGDTNSLCGTLQIFKEGISYNPFSCVILAAPINNDSMLEQVIGRIQRMYPDKLSPVVVDLILRGRTTENQYMNRAAFYLKQEFPIKRL